MQRNTTLTYWIDVTVVVLATLLVRWVGIGHLPFDDELFHVLAAHSWSVEGTLRLVDGVYTRASLFSILIGYLFRVCGESLLIARLPALLAGSLWILVVFLWVRAYVGRAAAWISAGLFSFAPHAIELSQLCRFYTLHGLLFWLGATGWFALLTQQRTVRASVRVAGLTILSLGIAVHLQSTTFIGLAALAVWSILALGSQWWPGGGLRPKRFWLLACCIGLAGLVTVYLMNRDISHYVRPMLQLYNRTPYSSAGQDALSYFRLFLTQYPSLWPLMPLALLGAIAVQPKVGTFCACMFSVPFLLHSAAGTKEERYIYYAMPFFFITWGIVLAALWPSLQRLVRSLVEQSLAATMRRCGDGWLKQACAWGVLGILLLFVLGSNGAFPRLLHLLHGQSYYFGIQPSDWRAAPEYLKPDIDRAAVIVTTNITKAAYYFGRFDFVLNKAVLVETALSEFALDGRTGRPVVSSVESLHLILSCFSTGIFIGEQSEWRFGGRIDAAAADVLEAYAKPLSLPPQWQLVAFTWERPAGPLPPQCASLQSMPAMTAISMQGPPVGQ